MNALIVLCLLPVAAVFGQLGGITSTTLAKDAEPVQFALKSINDHLAQNNGGHSLNLGLVDIVSARTQVVAGQKLYLTLHLTGDYFCDINVWYRSWLTGADRLIVTDGPTCHRTQNHPAPAVGMAGGVSNPEPLPQDTTNEVHQALQFGACHVNDRVNYMYSLVLGDKSSIMYTHQVTAGMTYHFMGVPMMPTQCRNNGCNGMDSSCQANSNAQAMTCDITVQWQAWSTPQYTLTSVHC